ncbi:MAG TPA: hypothetical protein PKY87_02260 [Terricaulis sp.]|nr:hypothetical protein [Terricaulis sp.]
MAAWKPGEYCHCCNNDGVVNCYCGGDLCVCENYGEMDCPRCYGASTDDYDPDDDYGSPDDEPARQGGQKDG